MSVAPTALRRPPESSLNYYQKAKAMLNSVSHLKHAAVAATDGPIGHVNAAFFDDQSWTIRYLVVDTGTWLAGREVLISPYAVGQPLGRGDTLRVTLTCEQVRGSPDIDTHQPVSRQHERQYLGYYAYPEYWTGGGVWGMGAYPLMPAYLPGASGIGPEPAEGVLDVQPDDVHLRSSDRVNGYDIQASDASIGHVEDFIFDEESWVIRYLVVDTRNWWPGGRKVLVATRWIDRIDWATRTVGVMLTREQVKNSPEYDPDQPLDRNYETRLHEAYGRQGYWD